MKRPRSNGETLEFTNNETESKEHFRASIRTEDSCFPSKDKKMEE